MDGHRTGPPKGAGEQNPAYRPTHHHHLAFAPEPFMQPVSSGIGSGHNGGHMASQGTERQRILLTIVVACVVIVVADIIAINISGDDLFVAWTLAVPVGLLLVPLVGIVAFVIWFSGRGVRTS